MSNKDITLRPYQKKTIEAINNTAERGIKRQLIIMSTGMGKSYTLVFKILEAIKQNKKVFIMADQKDLVQQWKDYLQDIDDSLRIGIERAHLKAKMTDDVVIMTPQTLGREGNKRIKRFPQDHFSMGVLDECFTPDTEILTEDGFVRFDELPKDKKVAQFDCGTISFVNPTRYIKKQYEGKLHNIHSERGIDLTMTPNHDLLITNKKEYDKKIKCKDACFNYNNLIYCAGESYFQGEGKLSPKEKLMIALQADGSIHNKNKNGEFSLRFQFSREEKIEAFLKLMNEGDYTFNEVYTDTRLENHRRNFIITDVTNASKDITEHFDLDKISYEKAVSILEYAMIWDGHLAPDRPNSMYYSNTDKDAVDFYQAVGILANFKTYQSVQVDDRKETYKDVYRLFITTNTNKINTDPFKRKLVDYDGYVYCVEVPSGNIVVRRDGKVSVVGNCHKSIAPTWFRVLEYFDMGKDSFDQDNLLIGCTATGWRESGESMGILYDDIVVNYDLRYAINHGWLTDFELYDVETNTDLSGYSSQGEFDEAVDNEERNEEALKAYRQICDGEKVLIYTASVDHAYHLTELFNDAGIPSAVIEANTPEDEREQILQDYKDGKIKCIHNYSTMTTGINLPETSALMLLRAVQSKLLITQILGRGLRPSETAFVDVFKDADKRKKAIANSAKPTCKVIDLYDKVGNHNFAHVPSLFGLHNELKTNEPQKFYEEVVEPLEEKAKEHGFDKSKVKDLDDIDLIVKNRKVEISSLKLDPEIEQFTDRKWVSVGEDSYEIIYGEDNKVLMIEADQSKSELLDKKEWKLLEYDTKDGVTKELQTFNNISGAFKVGDELADRKGWNSQFKKKAPWRKKGVTEGQLETMNKVFKYKNGYSKHRMLQDRYSDTGVRQILWKPTGDVLTRGQASDLLDSFFNS